MSNEITITPAVVTVNGGNLAERKMSALTGASVGTLLALSNAKGEVGKLARNQAASSGLVSITKSASNGQYLPLAQYLAAKLGESFVIPGRASFESLPDQMEMRIMKIEQSKSGGRRTCTKTGLIVDSAALALVRSLKAECIEIISAQEAIRAKRAEDKAAATDTPMVSV